jgi:hypothetical protein
MGHMKRPETPHISETAGGIEITYNGVGLQFRISVRGNAIYERMIAIDETIEGYLVEAELPFMHTDEAEWVFKERNIALPEQREELMEIIREYAYWFTPEAEQRLEGLMNEHCSEAAREKRRQRQNSAPAAMPKDTYRDQQSREFRDVWRMVLSKNISPREAALHLGYDPREYE